jgi:hypothetical protein
VLEVLVDEEQSKKIREGRGDLSSEGDFKGVGR